MTSSPLHQSSLSASRPDPVEEFKKLSERLGLIRSAMGRDNFYPQIMGWMTATASSQPTLTVAEAFAQFADYHEAVR